MPKFIYVRWRLSGSTICPYGGATILAQNESRKLCVRFRASEQMNALLQTVGLYCGCLGHFVWNIHFRERWNPTYAKETLLPRSDGPLSSSELGEYFSFSPFAAVSLFGVAGLAETFPFFSVGGPFLLDFPGFQVPSDSIFPSQLWSSSRALPLHLHFCNCSDVFSFTSPFDVSKPCQPSPSHNRRYRFHLCFFQDFLISRVF